MLKAEFVTSNQIVAALITALIFKMAAYIPRQVSHDELQCCVCVPTIIHCLGKLKRTDIHLNRLQQCCLGHFTTLVLKLGWVSWQLCTSSVNGLSHWNCSLIDS